MCAYQWLIKVLPDNVINLVVGMPHKRNRNIFILWLKKRLRTWWKNEISRDWRSTSVSKGYSTEWRIIMKNQALYFVSICNHYIVFVIIGYWMINISSKMPIHNFQITALLILISCMNTTNIRCLYRQMWYIYSTRCLLPDLLLFVITLTKILGD